MADKWITNHIGLHKAIADKAQEDVIKYLLEIIYEPEFNADTLRQMLKQIREGYQC